MKKVAAAVMVAVVVASMVCADSVVLVPVRAPRPADTNKWPVYSAWMVAQPNRMVLTNVVQAVDPPIATNEWAGDGEIVSNGFVVAYTNTYSVEDPNEPTAHKEKRVLARILADRVRDLIRLWQIAREDRITRRERVVRNIVPDPEEGDLDD